ncbi:MAG TPA: FecR domain-containing protein [Chitinophagaceae bacterium]
MKENQKITDSFRAAALIQKYLLEALTDIEQIELDTWIEESDENRRLFSDLTNPAKLKPQYDEFGQWDPDAAYDRFMKKNFPVRVLRSRVLALIKRYGIAAAAVILVLIATAVWLLENDKPKYESITVPPEAEHEMVLEDGTRVRLNGSTTLTYPVTFTGEDRTVKLTGEGYFAVANDPTRPFYVNINALDVKVTGAAFNINAYTNHVVVNSAAFKEVSITDTSITFDPQPGQPFRIEGQGKFRIIKP